MAPGNSFRHSGRNRLTVMIGACPHPEEACLAAILYPSGRYVLL
jgi:hypothetical protein